MRARHAGRAAILGADVRQVDEDLGVERPPQEAPRFLVPVIPVPVDVAAFLLRVSWALRLQHPDLYGRRLHVLQEARMGDHLHAGVVLLEQVKGIDVEVLPPVEGAGGVVLAVLRDPLAQGPALFPVEAGGRLGPVESGLGSAQLIPPQHVLDDDEAVALVGLHLVFESGPGIGFSSPCGICHGRSPRGISCRCRTLMPWTMRRGNREADAGIPLLVREHLRFPHLRVAPLDALHPRAVGHRALRLDRPHGHRHLDGRVLVLPVVDPVDDHGLRFQRGARRGPARTTAHP